MTIRTVDEDIRLIPYYRNDAASLPWYQDLDVCKQVDDRDTPYDAALLHRMYDYLCANGDCWYIEYRDTLVGDISLRQRRDRHCGVQGVPEPAHRAAVLLTAICSESSGPRKAQGNFAVRATTPFPPAELPPSAKGAHPHPKLLAGSYLQCQTAFCSKSPRQRPPF